MNTHPQADHETVRRLLATIQAPRLPVELIARQVREDYGMTGHWQSLRGEREQNFRLETADGNSLVVKVASPEERPEMLHFQSAALEHIAKVDPEFAVPRLVRTRSGEANSTVVDDKGQPLTFRILTFLPGDSLFSQLQERKRMLEAEDLIALGATHGRLARALQGLRADGAPKTMPWDISNGLLLGPWLLDYVPQSIRDAVEALLPRFSRLVHDELPRLRAQVIHNDFHESNVLVRFTPSLEVSGVIDFGDMVFAPVAQDLAVSVASLIHWTPDPVHAAAVLVRGYQRFMPLEAGDLRVLRNLALARLVLQVALVSYQNEAHGRHDADLDSLQSLYMAAISRFAAISDDGFTASMMPSVVPAPASAPAPAGVPAAGLLKRRESVLGKTYTFYNEPLELVRGRGCRLYDASGNEYLDCYNNVANLGHCHPYVVEALARQASTVNTNSRYLHEELVRLSERLLATLPPSLDTVMFVCTGSEANDLAVRLARAATGNDGVIITENSYHGNTSTIAPLSLIDYDIADKPSWVEAVPPPNLYRGPYREGEEDAGRKYADFVTDAAQRLARNGMSASSLLIDSIFDANGALVPPQDYLLQAFEEARRAGALAIADEVQMGFGRSGNHMWGFKEFGVEPDIVTMGKPMGNGHPIAAVATRREIARLVQEQTGYFNTFGGNTVSAAVGNACLDVLHGEDLQDNARRTGEILKAGLAELFKKHEIIGHIHGRGLFYGVELVSDRNSQEPAKLAARWVRERMKVGGVLVSSTGPLGNIIKIRPPLVMTATEALHCLETLNCALTEIPAEMHVPSRSTM